MACGLPVVATDVGGAPDVVTSGQSGWLVPAEDPVALQNAILTALADSSLHQHMGHQARQVIVERYSLDTVANKLVNLYRILS